MQTMISTGLKSYAGKDLNPGEKFEVEDQHVRTLEVTRKAKKAPAKKESPAKDMSAGNGGTYQTRDMTADAGAAPRTTKNADAKK